jgi:hypothetical protein
VDADLLWFVAAILVLGALAYSGVRRLLKQRAAQKWPTVTGAVSSSTLEMKDRGEQSMHVATVIYSYLIDGATHSGQHERSFLLYGRATKWIARYPEGAAVSIRYNADDVGDSILLQDDQTTRRLRRRTIRAVRS